MTLQATAPKSTQTQREELGSPVTRSQITEMYLSQNVPGTVVAFLYLATMNDKPERNYYGAEIDRLFLAGSYISDYINTELAQEHPTDKRFLLRYMELLCTRYDLNQFKSTGFGHDVIFSKTPLDEHYPKFDNSLYVPPLTGYWAIASKSAARD